MQEMWRQDCGSRGFVGSESQVRTCSRGPADLAMRPWTVAGGSPQCHRTAFGDEKAPAIACDCPAASAHFHPT